MRYGFDRPKAVQLLSRMPVIGGPLNTVHDRYLEIKYEWNWRFLGNRWSKSRFDHNAPSLTNVQRSILDNLRTSGLAITRFQTLFPSGKWEKAQRAAEEFASSDRVRQHAAKYLAAVAEAARIEATRGTFPPALLKFLKAYFITYFSEEARPTIDPNDDWMQLALTPEILGIVNSYFGLLARN